MSKVYITGAGPGDVELLTLKAYRVIKNADVIIYDNLVSKDILNLIKSDAKLIYVGKKSGRHTLPQNEINKIIYENSLIYESVVRLKGGDPFVFGRGGEEALFLKQKAVSFEIIPAVSSCIAVPAYAGIPVTHRGMTTSFRVVTGHEASSKKISQLEWNTFLNNETIIFLMGLKNIKLITSRLLKLGKDKSTPCAVISNGTTNEQEVIIGTIDDIVEKSKNMTTPATIVIGEVVRLREQLNWFKI